MSIQSLRRTGSCRFLIALLTLATWPGVAATQDDSAGPSKCPDDAWMVDSPFYQDFSAAGKIEVQGTGLELQGSADDAWMMDSPFYQDFSAAGKIEVQGTALELLNAPDDAWMVDSPFYQDFSEAGRIEAGTTALESLGISDNAWE